jgi:hypothetical protein
MSPGLPPPLGLIRHFPKDEASVFVQHRAKFWFVFGDYY